MEFYIETQKQKKGVVVNLPMMKTEDGRHWIELESLMVGIAKIKKEDIKELIKHVPKPYLKTVDKKKYIDRLAIGMIASQLYNYEFYKFTVARTNNKFDKYAPMLAVEMLNMVNNKTGNISMFRNELSNSDKARNDLLHDNENIDDLNQKEKAEFYDKLSKLQRERRRIKTQLECLTMYRNFLDSHNIKGSEIVDLQNNINGLMNLASKRIYNQRATTVESKKFLDM